MTMLRLNEVCRICTGPETSTNKLISVFNDKTNWLHNKLLWYLPQCIPRNDSLLKASICEFCIERFSIYYDFIHDCCRGQQFFEKLYFNMTPFDIASDETTMKDKSSDTESSELSIKREAASDDEDMRLRIVDDDSSLPLNLSCAKQSTRQEVKSEVLVARTPVIVYPSVSSVRDCSSQPSTSQQIKPTVVTNPFSNPSKQSLDQRSHTKQQSGRELVCNYCGKKLYHRGDFNKHLRKHTKEKPYECDICSKKFAHSSNMTRHKLVHSGELPYECEKCQKRFSRKDKLATHKKCRNT